MLSTPFRKRHDDKKRLLAIDGGGLRGILAVEVLARMESDLRRTLGDADLVLSDYFDYIAGTSTGGIIATCLSLGMAVDDIRRFYFESARYIFQINRNPLSRVIFSKYQPDGFERLLREVLGSDTTLGSGRLKSLLMLVMLNASTCSPWPVSSNPQALFNQAGEECNLDIPLWQLVRASAAAPLLFPAEAIRIGGRTYLFRDGALTSLNNPAMKLFQMASLPAYRLGWPNGADRMLLVSVGTGSCPVEIAQPSWKTNQLAATIGQAVRSLMAAGSAEQDLACRILGRCVAGEPIDAEVGGLHGSAGWGLPPLFTYARYNAELTLRGLDAIGCASFAGNRFQLDDIASLPVFQAIGKAVAETRFDIAHFDGFL
ncbi:patatin-like phospholipase family protein [Noviherbaspirillum pedocola]|uniref:Patatin-like phospholipase family protein n=1 Tax=Noviherbaspirillum pedocola TaxID=2801341 RepID=A0A934STL9_9BURK|nr:patatin-like phospholipase family protein [Noviherbaspirillum pedocola]MBK4735289.1 patatin-like phospholipase family protein [Noviherbaspirillum pedocola]